MLNCLAVGAGGFIGAVLRYLITLIKIPETNSLFPATLITNIIGSFALGFLMGLSFSKKELNPYLMIFLKVGVCGGFTTFSTMTLEIRMISKIHPMLGVGYAAVSVALGVAALLIGNHLAAILVGKNIII